MAKQIYFLNKGFSEGKKVRQALQSIFGIGNFYASQICDIIGIGPESTFGDLSPNMQNQLQKLLQTRYYTGSDLALLIQQDVQHFVSIGTTRGIRHTLGLPVRGQRTRTNAKTSRKRQILKKSFK